MIRKKSIIAFLLLIAIMLSLNIGLQPAQAATLDLIGRVIFLDPGHGIGATGGGNLPTYTEHVRMLYLANQIASTLVARGATVYLTRSTSNDVLLPARMAFVNMIALRAVRDTYTDDTHLKEIDRLIGVMQSIINSPVAEGTRFMNTPFNASRTIHSDLRKTFEYLNNPLIRNNFLLISLHSNAPASASSTGVRGAEVYYINPAEFFNTATYYTGYPYVTQSRNFANILLNHIAGVYHGGNNIPRRANGLRAENYFVNREVGIPSVLAENGFHTNATDRALLLNNTYMNSLAVAYGNAVSQYFAALPSMATSTPYLERVEMVEQFVFRLYETALGREPDPSGFINWQSRIMTGRSTGASVAYSFIFSTEFLAKNVTNEEYVDILYRTLLNREPEPAGMTNWLNHLNARMSRERVFSSFVNSPEYRALCLSYGIAHGTFTPPAGKQTFYIPSRDIIEAFVTRLYKEALDREPDAPGLRNWTDHLVTGRMTGSSVANSFIFSQEVRSKNLDNDEFIELLYKAILGRESDPSGKASWLNNMRRGMSRQTVANHFYTSPEFTAICNSYMIKR